MEFRLSLNEKDAISRLFLSEKSKNYLCKKESAIELINIKNPKMKNTVGFKTGIVDSFKEASYGFSVK